MPSLVLFLFCVAALAQEIEPGKLPASWRTGGPNCLEAPAWQIHQYNPGFYILRQSGCTHYEKPFLYLIVGATRALLVDTGAGESDAAAVVTKLLAAAAPGRELVVAHSHGHGDHTAGDKGFAAAPGVTLIPATPEANAKAFGIAQWPDSPGSIDLGNRVVDVLAIPGHQPAHLAYYDRRTAILLTGDHLYPGRLYVNAKDFQTYLASTRRMVAFTAGKPIAHILGCHIEQTNLPFLDYPTGTKYQPEEHALALGWGNLLELMTSLEAVKDAPQTQTLRDFTIVLRK